MSKAFESLTLNTEVVSLTQSIFGTRTNAFITIEGGPVRFRTDGGNPTNAIGHLLVDGDSLILETNSEIASFKAINVNTAGLSAAIQVTYDKEL